MNKKGMDISLNFVILAVLALIALILVALFFTGGLSNLFKQTEEVGSTSAEQLALYKSKCSLYCSTDNIGGWDNPGFPDDLEDTQGKSVKNCDYFEELNKVWNSDNECKSKSST
ncbi:hypothetical protein HOG31_03120 [archaeon]|nr:hypothetical protein [archaeon]MBT3730968.1 hypothetical protein [archaeon]MBT4669794.1 hypothetical protein [archaeon]MBT7053391.1 hypothetical protein [archaeon]